MANYKVLIASAGIGSRVENYSKNFNKALISVGRKPAICYIIDKIPKDVEIVVTVGYKKDYLIQFLSLVYSDRNIKFVDVDKFAGEGSGLGYSILKAKDELQCPFMFIANDCITDEEFTEPTHNFMNFSIEQDTTEYRTMKLQRMSSVVSELIQKGDRRSSNAAYIGLCGIYNYNEFWKYMVEGVEDGSIEQGESYAISKMLNAGMQFNGYPSTWYDTGNVSKYIATNKHFSKDDHINILDKEDETIWFIDDKVVKFHNDKTFISQRVKRTQVLGKFVPEILGSTENMYMYKRVDGDTFTYNLQYDKFEKFLGWIKDFWVERNLNETENEKFRNVCKKFYYDKTMERVNEYYKKYNREDSVEIINGKRYDKLSDILNRVPWETLINTAKPTNFHGDLHFENILVNKDSFSMLDWRQSFGGIIEYGDVYYDLAKLKHGFIISHEMVNEELYRTDIEGDVINFYFMRKNVLSNIEKMFDDFVIKMGYDLKQVNILTAMIYLNVAALHHHPYSDLLYYLGKTMLSDVLEE